MNVSEMKEYYLDNPVAKLLKAGKRVVVLILKGNNSDYVRMSSLYAENGSSVYGIPLEHTYRKNPEIAWTSGSQQEEYAATVRRQERERGAIDTMRLDMIIGSLCQHRPDAIVIHTMIDGQVQYAIFELTEGRLPTMSDIVAFEDTDE